MVGPTLGGWLADNVSWHWCFLINVPGRPDLDRADRAIVQRVRRRAEKRERLARRRPDSTSSASCWSRPSSARLEVVLDRGLEDDWFGSSFIVGVRGDLGDSPSLLMIPWEMTPAATRLIDVRMVATRQFGACFVVMLATGAFLLATTQFLPQLLQEDFGYTATLAGLVLSPGGVVTMVMMFVVGRAVGTVQPQISDHDRRA